MPGPMIAREWGPAWFWTSLVLMIIGHDAWFYWTHRLIHDRRLFRTFHRRHHRSNSPSPFTAYSFDLGEAAINALFVPLWMLLVPTQWPAVGLFMLHQIVRNTLGHSGYELFPATRDGRPLLPWLTTVTHHDLHHAQAGWNYGLYFTWWDRLMGTENPRYLERFAEAVRDPDARP
jgi:sterol desaturase/sphingolipid hydroxylase (fatty acid hydroxylase superfamily)